MFCRPLVVSSVLSASVLWMSCHVMANGRLNNLETTFSSIFHEGAYSYSDHPPETYQTSPPSSTATVTVKTGTSSITLPRSLATVNVSSCCGSSANTTSLPPLPYINTTITLTDPTITLTELTTVTTHCCHNSSSTTSLPVSQSYPSTIVSSSSSTETDSCPANGYTIWATSTHTENFTVTVTLQPPPCGGYTGPTTLLTSTTSSQESLLSYSHSSRIESIPVPPEPPTYNARHRHALHQIHKPSPPDQHPSRASTLKGAAIIPRQLTTVQPILVPPPDTVTVTTSLPPLTETVSFTQTAAYEHTSDDNDGIGTTALAIAVVVLACLVGGAILAGVFFGIRRRILRQRAGPARRPGPWGGPAVAGEPAVREGLGIELGPVRRQYVEGFPHNVDPVRDETEVAPPEPGVARGGEAPTAAQTREEVRLIPGTPGGVAPGRPGDVPGWDIRMCMGALGLLMGLVAWYWMEQV